GARKSKLAGRAVDEGAFEKRLPSAVAEIVAQQAQTGIDVVDDGEMSKAHFVSYAEQRLTGFETREITPEEAAQAFYLAGSREYLAFPEYYEPEGSSEPSGRPAPRETFCDGPVAYRGHELLQRDIANLRAAVSAAKVEEAFFPATAPNQVAYRRRNEYYRT